jgi:biopolymer transport protein ExbD
MVTLMIDADGAYSLADDGGVPQKLADQQLETLKQALQKLAVQAKEVPFIINADGKTPHQSVITALEAASEAGFSHITFAAEHTKSKQ